MVYISLIISNNEYLSKIFCVLSLVKCSSYLWYFRLFDFLHSLLLCSLPVMLLSVSEHFEGSLAFSWFKALDPWTYVLPFLSLFTKLWQIQMLQLPSRLFSNSTSIVWHTHLSETLLSSGIPCQTLRRKKR